MSILGWRGEASGKWICIQPLLHFFASPQIRPEFIENSYADDSEVSGVAIFLSGVRFANRPKRNAATASVLCRKPSTFNCDFGAMT